MDITLLQFTAVIYLLATGSEWGWPETLRWLDSLEQVPTIVALKERFEEIRQRELEKFLGTSLKGLSDKERQALEDMTSAMINKILHSPLTRLRTQPEDELIYVETLKKLFDVVEKEDEK